MDIQTIDPHEIERKVLLALVLEPLSEKKGCTTRLQDIDHALKLQYFQASAINTGKYFYLLAKRVKEHGGQPPVFFDLAKNALDDSLKNIDSTKSINHGLISLFMPLVLSSLLVDGNGKEVCAYVPKVLQDSSPEDVQFFNDFEDKAFSTSKDPAKRIFGETKIQSDSLYESHEQKIEVGKSVGYIGAESWSGQLIKGLPLLCDMYDVANKYKEEGILISTEKAYDHALEELPYDSPGTAADYSAAVAYLLFRDAGSEKNLIT